MDNKTKPTPELLAARIKEAETALMRDQDAARSRMEADLRGMIDTIKLNQELIDGIHVVLVARPNRVLAMVETGVVGTVLAFSRGGSMAGDQIMANVLEDSAEILRSTIQPSAPRNQVMEGVIRGLMGGLG